jgi:hypothetical protein
MFGLGRAVLLSGLAIATAAATRAPGMAQEPDVFAKRGVYAETDRGLIELTHYAEGRAISDSIMKAYRYRIEPTRPVPRAAAIASFVVNEPGARADAWMATTQLMFVVGRDVEQGSNVYFQMTTKVTKLRASVYLIVSPELQGPWMRNAYAKAREKFSVNDPPEAFIGLLLQEWSGQPRRLYPVQLFP